MKFKKPKFWDQTKLSIWSILLLPFSFIYFFFSQINKFKKKKKFSIPIICIGNIYLGGTGKTPLAKEVFNLTRSFGKNPAFVKKYYNYLEDEINFLKETGRVFSNKNRIDAIKELIKNQNDIAILDDGFQDFSIKKDFSILCFNKNQWLGNKFLIPSGPLREGLNSLKRANCVIINGDKDLNIERKINNISNLKIFYSQYKPKNLNKFINKKIFAFAGIGNPTNFCDLLKKNNLDVKNFKSFPDHYNYKKEDLENMKIEANNLGYMLVTTEKDYFRIDRNLRKDIEKFDIELEIKEKDQLINLIKKSL
tara:strand:- start:235 stop:1158 length:924 start_codon:yes stop_codon:yes gene_type:complete